MQVLGAGNAFFRLGGKGKGMHLKNEKIEKQNSKFCGGTDSEVFRGLFALPEAEKQLNGAKKA